MASISDSVSIASMTTNDDDDGNSMNTKTKTKKIKNPFKKLLKGIRKRRREGSSNRRRRRRRDSDASGSSLFCVEEVNESSISYCSHDRHHRNDDTPAKELAVIREQVIPTGETKNDPTATATATTMTSSFSSDTDACSDAADANANAKELYIMTPDVVLSDDETVVVNHRSTHIIRSSRSSASVELPVPVPVVVQKKRSSWIVYGIAIFGIMVLLAAATLYGWSRESTTIPTATPAAVKVKVLRPESTIVDHHHDEDVATTAVLGQVVMTNETLFDDDDDHNDDDVPSKKVEPIVESEETVEQDAPVEDMTTNVPEVEDSDGIDQERESVAAAAITSTKDVIGHEEKEESNAISQEETKESTADGIEEGSVAPDEVATKEENVVLEQKEKDTNEERAAVEGKGTADSSDVLHAVEDMPENAQEQVQQEMVVEQKLLRTMDIEKEEYGLPTKQTQKTTVMEKISNYAQVLLDKSTLFLVENGGSSYYQDAQRFAVETKQYWQAQGVGADIYQNAQLLAEQSIDTITAKVQILVDKSAQFLVAQQGANDIYRNALLLAEHSLDGFTKNSRVWTNKTAQFLSEQGVLEFYTTAKGLLANKSARFLSVRGDDEQQWVRYGTYGLACTILVCLLLLVLRLIGTTAVGKSKVNRKENTDEESYKSGQLDRKETRRQTKKHNRRWNKRSNTNDANKNGK